MSRKGFTLIELLVVIAIIGILATLVITQVAGAQVRARNSNAKSDVNQMAKAVEVYRTNNNVDNYVNSNAASGGAAGTTMSGTTAAGAWATIFGTSSADGIYPIRITRTAGNSASYTYGYTTNTNTNPGTDVTSTSYCVGTNVVNSNGVNDGGFFIVNGTSTQKANGTPGVTYGSGTCS